MITKDIKVWLGGAAGVTAPVHLSQYDTGWAFRFSIYDGSTVYSPSATSTVLLEGRKSDGTVFSVPGKFVDGIAIVECEATITAAIGKVSCELRVSDRDTTVGTANFEMLVESAPLTGYIASGDDFSAMMQVLDGAERASARSHTYAADAAGFADDAARSAASAQVQAGMAYKIAKSAEDMTDTSIGYVYVGAEPGYSYGSWYYWDGSSWAVGGASVDPTLSIAGAPADAKASGDTIRAVSDVKAPAIFLSASGAVASFDDVAGGMPLKSLTVTVLPAQAGEGTPSPDNIRPISGWTGCVLSHSGADTSDPDTLTVTFPAAAGTVYGGTLDLTTGRLSVDRIGRTFAGASDESWAEYGEGANRYFRFFDYRGVPHTSLARGCSHFANVSIASGNTSVGYYVTTGSGSKPHTRLQFRPANIATNYPTVSSWRAWLAEQNADGTPLTCWWRTAAPVAVYSLDPATLRALPGSNRIWADCGDVETEYPADTQIYVDRVAAESSATATKPVGDVLLPGLYPPEKPGLHYSSIFSRGYISTDGAEITNTLNARSYYFDARLIKALSLLDGCDMRFIWYSSIGTSGYMGQSDKIMCGRDIINYVYPPDGAVYFRVQLTKVPTSEVTDADLSGFDGALTVYAGSAYSPYTDAQQRAAFVSYMAEMCTKLGMLATTFANASGLTSESQTTPADMLKLVIAIAGNPLAMDIWSTRDRDFTVGGVNHRTISVVSNVYSAEPSGAQYKLLGGKGGTLNASSGGGKPRKARIAVYEVAGRPVAVSLAGQSSWASTNLINCAQELCGMMEVMLTGGTPTEGAYLSQLVSDGGGYAAIPVPICAGAYLNAYSAAELLAHQDALSRNATTTQIPASTSKAMTMLCVLSLASDLNEIVEVKSGDILGGSGSAFDTGDRLTVIDALRVMMMESSNTLAEALGRFFGVKLLKIEEKR